MEQDSQLSEQQKQKLKAEQHSKLMDRLYFVGSLCVVGGIYRGGAAGHAAIAAGTFAFIPPALELAAGFIRGLRK